MQNDMSNEITMLRLDQVRQIVGLSRTTIYTMMAAGQFPKQVQISLKAVGWPRAEIQQWLAERVKTSRQQSDC